MFARAQLTAGPQHITARHTSSRPTRYNPLAMAKAKSPVDKAAKRQGDKAALKERAALHRVLEDQVATAYDLDAAAALAPFLAGPRMMCVDGGPAISRRRPPPVPVTSFVAPVVVFRPFKNSTSVKSLLSLTLPPGEAVRAQRAEDARSADGREGLERVRCQVGGPVPLWRRRNSVRCLPGCPMSSCFPFELLAGPLLVHYSYTTTHSPHPHVYWCTRAHSPHCPPWPGHSFPDCLLTVYQCTRTHSPHPAPWPHAAPLTVSAGGWRP